MPNLLEFNEALHSSTADPLDDRHCDFDWETLYANLNESQPEVAEDRDWKGMTIALTQLLRWIVAVDLERAGAEGVIARRCIALLWTVNPDYFDGSPSITVLAEKLGITKGAMGHYSGDASRKFGVRNRGQSHAGNFNPQGKCNPANN